jgi:selenide,water dikinase
VGTGILSTALKNRLIDEPTFAPVAKSMATLNRKAAELMLELGVHSCTDITGFGLIGHASHLVQEGETGLEFDFNSIPIFPEALEFSRREVYPGGLGRNRDYYMPQIEFKGKIEPFQSNLLFDPQTSGGLLMTMSEMDAAAIELNYDGFYRIGRVLEAQEHPIILV